VVVAAAADDAPAEPQEPRKLVGQRLPCEANVLLERTREVRPIQHPPAPAHAPVAVLRPLVILADVRHSCFSHRTRTAASVVDAAALAPFRKPSLPMTVPREPLACAAFASGVR
jgi:hypothetical protein